MRNASLFLFIGFTSFNFAQDYYSKKGYTIDGYDVVSYFKNGPEKGKKEFTVLYQNNKFLFSSKTNLEKFKTLPEKYLPQYGGYCAYAMAKNGKKVSINPKSFEISRGKLYLFYNNWGTNTLKLWQKENPELLKTKADAFWKKQSKTKGQD